MSESPRSFPLAEVTTLIAAAPEPFLIPDVTPNGWRPSTVFHVVRDLVDDGYLTYGDDGYRRVALIPEVPCQEHRIQVTRFARNAEKRAICELCGEDVGMVVTPRDAAQVGVTE